MRARSKTALCILFIIIMVSMYVNTPNYPSTSSILEAPGKFQGEALFLPTFNEIKVNTYTADAQLRPAISALTADTFAVAWSSDGQDGSGLGVYAAVFNATTGANLTAEFRVNTYTLNSQDNSAISALTADTFVVAWDSSGQDGSGYGVYAAVFNATTGANLTAEFRMNSYTANDQFSPSVCTLTADTFAAAWSSFGQDGSDYGIYAAVFNATTGANLTAEFRANTNTTNSQWSPSVCALTADTFAVAWDSSGQDGSGWGVYAAVFNATTGANLTPEFRVNTYTANDQSNPAVSALSVDTFVVAWQSDGQDGNSYGIYAAVFNATTGANLTAEFRVNNYTPYAQTSPSVCALSADTFVVAWESNLQDGSMNGIYATVFDRLKAPLLNSMPIPSVNGTIHLTWSVVLIASWYYVFRATAPITDLTGLVAIATTTACNFTDTNLENGEYFYVIVAGHPRGNSSISNCENNIVLIPLVGPFLSLILPEIDEDGIVELKWSKIPKSTTYYLYRDTSYIFSTEGMMPIAAIAGTNYTDQLLNNDYYYYAVVASDGWVNSSVSNCQYVSVEMGGVDSQPDNTWLFILIAGIIIAAAIIVHGFLVRGRPSGQSPPEKLPLPPKPKK